MLFLILYLTFYMDLKKINTPKQTPSGLDI